VKDRGRIKWSPFLIPQHKKRIAMFYESEDDVKQPELDEQLIEKIQTVLSAAMEDECEVNVVYYQTRRRKESIGIVKKVDPIMNLILIDSRTEGCAIKIPFKDIGDIEILHGNFID